MTGVTDAPRSPKVVDSNSDDVFHHAVDKATMEDREMLSRENNSIPMDTEPLDNQTEEVSPSYREQEAASRADPVDTEMETPTSQLRYSDVPVTSEQSFPTEDVLHSLDSASYIVTTAVSKNTEVSSSPPVDSDFNIDLSPDPHVPEAGLQTKETDDATLVCLTTSESFSFNEHSEVNKERQITKPKLQSQDSSDELMVIQNQTETYNFHQKRKSLKDGSLMMPHLESQDTNDDTLLVPCQTETFAINNQRKKSLKDGSIMIPRLQCLDNSEDRFLVSHRAETLSFDNADRSTVLPGPQIETYEMTQETDGRTLAITSQTETLSYSQNSHTVKEGSHRAPPLRSHEINNSSTVDPTETSSINKENQSLTDEGAVIMDSYGGVATSASPMSDDGVAVTDRNRSESQSTDQSSSSTMTPEPLYDSTEDGILKDIDDNIKSTIDRIFSIDDTTDDSDTENPDKTAILELHQQDNSLLSLSRDVKVCSQLDVEGERTKRDSRESTPASENKENMTGGKRYKVMKEKLIETTENRTKFRKTVLTKKPQVVDIRSSLLKSANSDCNMKIRQVDKDHCLLTVTRLVTKVSQPQLAERRKRTETHCRLGSVKRQPSTSSCPDMFLETQSAPDRVHYQDGRRHHNVIRYRHQQVNPSISSMSQTNTSCRLGWFTPDTGSEVQSTCSSYDTAVASDVDLQVNVPYRSNRVQPPPSYKTVVDTSQVHPPYRVIGRTSPDQHYLRLPSQDDYLDEDDSETINGDTVVLL